MPPKQAKRGRKRRPNRVSVTLRAPSQAVVQNPGGRLKVVTRSIMYDFQVKLSVSSVEDINISLIELLGKAQGKSVQDWYDEFKLSKLVLSCTAAEQEAGNVDSVVCCPDYTSLAPTTYSELLRMSGSRIQPVSFAQGTMLLGVCRKPTFDATGSDNQFRNDWLSTSAVDTEWHGFRVSTTSAKGMTLECVIRATVQFRGMQ